MLATKKQSINIRLAFYAKLGDKLDAIGQQLVEILCKFEKQAVTIEQLIAKSQVYNLLQFSLAENAHVHKRTDEESAENVGSNVHSAKLNVYEKYLNEAQTNCKQWKRNSIQSARRFLILFSYLLVSLLVSAIWLSPAFRNQLHLIIIYFISSFTQFVGLSSFISQESTRGFCSLPIINGLQSAFLPPFDCDNCANLTKVAKVSNLDYYQFKDR